MSKSFQKRQAILEAVTAYELTTSADRGAYRWPRKMAELLEAQGWATSHPGSDKWVAIKGPVVAKWIGRSGWSDNAIEDEIRIFRALKRLGLGKHVPRVYAFRNRELIVEQRCPSDAVCYDDVEAFNHSLMSNHNIEIIDLHYRNARRINGVLKVIDGRISELH